MRECYYLLIRHYARLDSPSDKDFKQHFWAKLADLEKIVRIQSNLGAYNNQKWVLSDYLIGTYYDNLKQVDSAIYYLAPFSKAYQNDSAHSRTILSETYVTLAHNYEVSSTQSKKTVLLDSALFCFKMNLLNYANDKNVVGRY